MQQYKTLYVSDMDGTLLNSNSVLSETTTAKLNELIQGGALFTVATARTPATVVSLMKDVKSNLPYILMAGCALWDNTSKRYDSARILSQENVEKLIRIFERNDNNPFIYYKNGNQIVVNHIKEFTAEEREFIEPRIKTPLKTLKTCDHLTIDSSLDGVMLIFSMGKFNKLRAIADEIDKQGIECTYNCYHDIFSEDDGIIDIYVNGTTKAAAIKELAKHIGANRIVVFGDNLNDIPMMKAADWSVAVSNAFDEVKEYADEIIDSNNNDAVVRWIEKDMEKTKNK